MGYLKDIPIQIKLRRVIMLTSMSVLLLTCLSFFIYEYQTFRHTTVRNLSTLGKIVATNSTAALAFQSPEDAAEVLAALSAEPHIVEARLFDKEGKLFSKYPQDLIVDSVEFSLDETGFHFADGHLKGYQPVFQDDLFLGTLYLKSDLKAMDQRFKLYGIIVLLVVLIAVLLAYQLSIILQKKISKPIIALAETARAISGRKDYKVRATKNEDDELGALTDAFNHMLMQIEERNEAISSFNKNLENKVIERTRDLELANKEQKEAERKINLKNKELAFALKELQKTEEELKNLNNELEQRVLERTNELSASEEKLMIKNKELERTNIDLDNFVYRASHDLKSPISNIEGLTLILNNQLEGRLNDEEQKLMHMIEISLAKFRETINDLTEISKVQKNREHEEEEVYFEAVLEDVKEDIRELIYQSGVVIKTNFEVASINYAHYNLKSILYNLISNAIKYRSDRPLEIDIITKLQDEGVLLSVKDNGLGMAEVDYEKIFSMFKRLHAHVEGSGIGLYITKRIIENQGGKIEVESKLNQGTTFKVFFNL